MEAFQQKKDFNIFILIRLEVLEFFPLSLLQRKAGFRDDSDGGKISSIALLLHKYDMTSRCSGLNICSVIVYNIFTGWNQFLNGKKI